jgi:argininosuccinate lyase
MWEGRFAGPLDSDFDHWQRSFAFDWRLLPHELAASRAHAAALADAGVLTAEECAAIARGLDAIAQQWGVGQRPEDDDAEDVHHFVERRLTDLLGDLALKLHTGRSRNEQIATDLRLYVRDSVTYLDELLAGWATALLEQAKALGDAVMPAYTHLQRAEPVLAAHWLLAYVEMVLRDAARLRDAAARANLCPLGSGAVAGATLPLDRELMARLLHFDGPTANSMDATSDRDFVLDLLQALTTMWLHISRFAEEITLFATEEFGFVALPDSFATGSSAMPQKKNPDLTELLRARAGRIFGASAAVTMQMKGLPLAYNKDLQELQPSLFFAVDETRDALALLQKFTAALRFRTEKMRAACETGFLNAMAAATYLTAKGVPFRTAHGIVGRAVRLCLDKTQSTGSPYELADVSLAELQSLSPAFDEDFYTHITLEATLACHNVPGGTAIAQVRAALANAEERLLALAGGSHACA